MMPLRHRVFNHAIITAFVFIFFLCPAVLGFSAPYGGCTDTNRTLFLTEPRMSGDDVVELQERLKELGYYKGKIDGVYGEKTFQAVKKIQSDSKMNPTGEVGVYTWKVLAADVKAPSVTTDISKVELSPDKLSIVIDTNERTLTLMEADKVYKAFPCAVGKPETPTPVGEWTIVHKGGNWGDGFGDRWMGLDVPWGIFGIHGTNKPYSIGTAASHGCIRMFNEHVRLVYSLVEEGTPVTIIGDPKMPP
jgi:lipoprotein-anchoring transpeptidase ErfK/SrfK